MRRLISTILTLTTLLIVSCKPFDDSQLWNSIDDLLHRFTALEEKVDQLNAQVASLSEITNGNVITSVKTDTQGNYVITYKDNDDIEHSIVIATMDDIIDLPIIGILQDDDGLYYWTQITDGETSWLTDPQGNKYPVSGYKPVISVDSQGYWMVDGKRILNASGQPVLANDLTTSLFLDVNVNAQGNLEITLGDGSVITLQVFEALNITFDVNVITDITDTSRDLVIHYNLSGAAAPYAIVDIARAENVNATINTSEKTITISFDDQFNNGSIIVMAYDLEDNTIIKPLYFNKYELITVEIKTTAELMQFAAAVNAGDKVSEATVLLMNDIDMSSVTDWEPIGNATFTWSGNVVTITGNTFRGTFDGQGYSLRNFRLVSTNQTAGGTFGLFGVLDGARVRNLTIGAPSGDQSALIISASAMTDAGVIAGLSYQSEIHNCVNYASMTYNGTSSQRITMAMVGMVFTNDASSYVTHCSNYGPITASAEGNTTNGATSVQVAGIVGFATNDGGSNLKNYITNCTNYAAIESTSGRTSGIVAATNRYTEVSYCTSNGDILNHGTISVRLGGITCIVSVGSSLHKCVNNGNYFVSQASVDNGQVGGVACLINNATASIVECENNGIILSNIFNNENASRRYIGAITANASNGTISRCRIGGAVGSFDAGVQAATVITAGNFEDYITGVKGASATFSDNVFAGEASASGIASVDDLISFAAAVNAGESIAPWQDNNGEVVLLNDIDMTGISQWTPIGTVATEVTSANTSVTYNTGNPFTGVFNGKGYAVRNIDWTFDLSDDTFSYGLFGAIEGATIKNLSVGTSQDGSRITLTGNAAQGTLAGGLAGYNNGGSIENCRNYADIRFAGDNATNISVRIGGIVGYLNNGTIGGTQSDSVVNYGNISCGVIVNTGNGANSGMHVGGICGFMDSGENTLISYATNYGNVSAPSGRGGGIAAVAMGGLLSDCTNNGLIQDDVDGIFASVSNRYNFKRMGGLVGGNNTPSAIVNSTNNGNVISQLGCRTGGFVGHHAGTIDGCTNNGDIITAEVHNDHGPGWACGFSAASSEGHINVRNSKMGGHVGRGEAFMSQPASAPEANNYHDERGNAFWYAIERYDPELNPQN